MTPQKVGFRKIDNEVFTALIAAKLPGGVYQVVLTVIDGTLGFQREKAAISLSNFQRRTRLSRQGVVNAIKYAKDKNIIKSEKINGKTTKYALDRDCIVKSALLDQSNRVDQAGQATTPRTEPVNKPLKKTYKENNDHFLEEMVTLSDNIKKVILYYLKAYQEHKGKPHSNLKPKQWQRVIDELEAFCDEHGLISPQDFEAIIDYHFQRKLKTDHNINHFATSGILENMFYKKLY